MVPDGFAYSYELPTISPVVQVVQDGFAYSFERVRIAPVAVGAPEAYVYAHESIILNPSSLTGTSDGYSYSYENVSDSTSPNPAALKVWDGTQWVDKPRYVWNGSAWVPIA